MRTLPDFKFGMSRDVASTILQLEPLTMKVAKAVERGKSNDDNQRQQ